MFRDIYLVGAAAAAAADARPQTARGATHGAERLVGGVGGQLLNLIEAFHGWCWRAALGPRTRVAVCASSRQGGSSPARSRAMPDHARRSVCSIEILGIVDAAGHGPGWLAAAYVCRARRDAVAPRRARGSRPGLPA
eukprot:SAG31_NODE_740_length_12438_cov_10.788719_8_plen_137_part_00